MSDEYESHLLGEALGVMLAQCRGAGFVEPLHMAFIACNGSMHYVRYDEDPEGKGYVPTPLVHHSEGDIFPLPVTIVMVDRQGKSERMSVTDEGWGAAPLMQ